MEITCISDLHGQYPTLLGGDLLIVGGDITAMDKIKQWMEFYDWFKAQPYRQKILIGGNHDGFLERCISSQEAREMMIDAQEGFEYLCDNGIEFEGLKIWGSPWTPRFGNWHFMLDKRDRMREKWDKIPLDTQLLVTHGPPFKMLDKNEDGEHVGCRDLACKILALRDLKLHIFGHIHECHGWRHQNYDIGDDTIIPQGHLSVNASLMDENYHFFDRPTRIYWDGLVMRPMKYEPI